MLESMTGYGHGKAINERFQVRAEIKSINSKGLETVVRLPAYYFQQEVLVKQMVAEVLERGKLSLALTVDVLDPAIAMQRVRVNWDMLKGYGLQLDNAAKSLGRTEVTPLASLLGLPGVVAEGGAEVSEEEWQLAESALRQALQQLKADRQREGNTLQIDITEHLDNVVAGAARVRELEKGRIDVVRQRLRNALDQLRSEFSVNEERFEQELIYYLDKFDINEEMVRLDSHLNHFRKTLEANSSQGRKLGFIIQELWREVNTLGVKAQDTQIQTIVVNMKDELEKIKEQLMNVV